MGTGTEVETLQRTPEGDGDWNGDGSEDSSGDGNGDEDNGNVTEDTGRAEERQSSARNRKIVVDAIWEAGETWVKRGKNVEIKGLVCPVAANPDNLESNKEAGGGAQDTQGSSKNCTSLVK